MVRRYTCLPRHLLLLFLVLFTAIAPVARAQVTTGSIEGTVLDERRQPLPGATVRITYEPTGARQGTTTFADGRFILANLRPGGPYTVLITAVGFADVEQRNQFVQLGGATRQTVVLRDQTQDLQAVTVTGGRNDVLSSDKNGQSVNLTASTIRNTPTLNRSLQDATRLISQGNLGSFGGSNYRFNNLSIDGMATNDPLGFQEPASGAAGSVASGTPGALAGTQPISLDAVDEVSVIISPFDVTLGNFTGANINAITKSGTNTLSGSAYAFGRNQFLTGRSVDDARTAIPTYYDMQLGFSLGGPILKNKLFYFANYERSRREEPVLNAPGDPGVNIPVALVQQIADTLTARYGYNPGTYGQADILRSSDKFLLKLDYLISDKHQLSLRNNYVTGFADNLERTPNFFNYGNQGYRHISKTNSLVAELKSRFSTRVSNKLILGLNTIQDARTFDGAVFPHLEITYNTANTIFAGTYREASIYGLTLNTFQLTDNLSIYRNKHTLTLGTNNEINSIDYRFLSAWNGRWQYSSPANFFADKPSRVRGIYNGVNNDYDVNKNTPSADFRVMLLSVYGQDDYQVSSNLTVQLGVRIDMQVHPDQTVLDANLANSPRFAGYKNKFGGVPQLNPRLGFNYRLSNRVQLRGGTGLFTGRIPFVWYAYSHFKSGSVYRNIDLKPAGGLPLTSDLASLQSIQPGLSEVSLIDNGFKLPRDFKTNLGVDVKLPNNVSVTLEGVYSNVLDNVLFQSINFKDSVGRFSGADNRPYFLASGNAAKVNPAFTNVFLLKNIHQGYSYNVTLSVRKQIRNKLDAMASYTYGESKDIAAGVRNSLAANYEWNQALVANSPALAYSNFDLRHKLAAYASYQFAFTESLGGSVGMVYTARSGSPFSFVYEGDVNRDGSAKNDLLFISASQSQITLQDYRNAANELVSAQQQWNQLDAYIRNDGYLSSRRGQYAARNEARTPWNHQLDMRLTAYLLRRAGQKVHKLEFTLDIINLTNLLNTGWGKQYFVPNVQNSGYALLDFVKLDGANPVFNFKNPSGTPWQIDPLNSRWQAQAGVRYSF